MKKVLSLLLTMALLVSLFPSALAAGSTFTLMVYMCGTDLETEGGLASADLGEMIASGVTRNGDLTVYVQTGGTKEWATKGLTNYEGERWLLSEAGLERVDSLGRVDMGSGDTFADFLAFGLQNYPADRYGVILWDHGAGSSDGVCYDEITGASLNMHDIYTAFTKASTLANYRKFAFVGFDACLMAAYEMAVHLQPFADIMIASEETEPGDGWPYDKWLPMLAKDAGADIVTIGKRIVDQFVDLVEKDNYGDLGTLSMLDLTKLAPLQAAVEQMGISLQGEIDGGNFNSISRIRQNVRSFGETSDAASDMIDLGVFASIFERYDADGAAALRAALADVVVYSRHTSNLSDISGLSVLVPYSTRDQASDYMRVYDTQNLMPAYTAFARSLADGMSGGSYAFSSAPVTQQSVQDATVDWFSQFALDPQSYYETYQSIASGDQTTYDDDFSLDSFISTLFSDSGTDFNTSAFDAGNLWNSEISPTGATVSSSSFGNLWGDATATQPATVAVSAGDETYDVQNPFAGATTDEAYSVTLTAEDMEHLSYAEASLMMDVSDPDFECYVDLGYTRDVIIDWNNNKIFGLFDGTWPTLDGQMVCIYDQVANEKFIRSLIPVTVNGMETYLLVVFDETNPGGVVVGYTEGYTDAGQPARGYEKLSPGDIVIPQYELLYWDENDEQQTEVFEGDPISVAADGTIPFGYEDVETEADYVYGFALNDVYGGYTYTDFITLHF